MFLIQISEVSFVNADKIEGVFFDKVGGELCICMVGANIGEHYIVDDDFAELVLNHLGGIDSGIGQVAVKLGELLRGSK